MRGVVSDLVKYLRAFSVSLQSLNFCEAEVTFIFSAQKKARKITNILRSLGSQAILIHSNPSSTLDALDS